MAARKTLPTSGNIVEAAGFPSFYEGNMQYKLLVQAIARSVTSRRWGRGNAAGVCHDEELGFQTLAILAITEKLIKRSLPIDPGVTRNKIHLEIEITVLKLRNKLW